MNKEVKSVIEGLIKSGTVELMKKSEMMPRQPFHELFMSWPENHNLALDQLRPKSITLMALCLMLRPLDFAPRAKILKGGELVSV